MFGGKTALQLLFSSGKGHTLYLDEIFDQVTVRDVLKSKHPHSQAFFPVSTISGTPPDSHPIMFESLDTSLICFSLLCASAAAAPQAYMQLLGEDSVPPLKGSLITFVSLLL